MNASTRNDKVSPSVFDAASISLWIILAYALLYTVLDSRKAEIKRDVRGKVIVQYKIKIERRVTCVSVHWPVALIFRGYLKNKK